MKNRPMDRHLSAGEVQALLEGELPERERALVEEHVASCAGCALEVEAWSSVFSELSALAPLTPREGFADRVMAGVRSPERVPLAARIRGWLGSLLPGSVGGAHGHPVPERLQDLLDGALTARGASRVLAHIEGCPTCTRQIAEWRGLLGRLEALPRFIPAEGFPDTVMARVRIPGPAAEVARTPARSRLLAAARRAVPRTRRAWATVSGVALTPAVSLGLVLYTVFSHPALTPGALASFLWWKVTDVAVATWDSVVARGLESELVFQIYSLLEAVVRAPFALAGGAAVFSALTGAALWVLYRNLISAHSGNGEYAHVEI